MDNSNRRKYELLGEPFGTANNKLHKAILFQMVQKLSLDICFRCGTKIEKVSDLSIEHKNSWQISPNPIVAFFDLDNIAFSHLKCNVSAPKKSTGMKPTTPHGEWRYSKYGCRCEICKEAHSKHLRYRYK